MFDVVEIDRLHNVIITESSAFAVVISTTQKYYQIKIPSSISNPVTSEYLAYKIGKKLDLPLPNGAFVNIKSDFFREIVEKIYTYNLNDNIKEKINNFIVDLSTNENIVIFALEWVYDTANIDDEEELLEFVDDVIVNDNEFYSVYSFDMLLCNFDRHYKNFIVDNKKSNILFIDHEKSFGSEDYSQIQNNIAYSECIYNNLHVSYLYDYITTDEQFDAIVEFSEKLDRIDSDYIDFIFDDFERFSSSNYEFEDTNLKNDISSFLTSRIGNITNYMINNKGECFDRIAQ